VTCFGVAALTVTTFRVLRVIEAGSVDRLVAAQAAVVRYLGRRGLGELRVARDVGPQFLHRHGLVLEPVDHAGLDVALDARDIAMWSRAPRRAVGLHLVTGGLAERGLIRRLGGADGGRGACEQHHHDDDRRHGLVGRRPSAYSGHRCPPRFSELATKSIDFRGERNVRGALDCSHAP